MSITVNFAYKPGAACKTAKAMAAFSKGTMPVNRLRIISKETGLKIIPSKASR